jgi:hypothetical protein
MTLEGARVGGDLGSVLVLHDMQFERVLLAHVSAGDGHVIKTCVHAVDLCVVLGWLWLVEPVLIGKCFCYRFKNKLDFYCTQPPHTEMTKLLCPHHEGAGSPHPIRVGGPDLWYQMALVDTNYSVQQQSSKSVEYDP